MGLGIIRQHLRQEPGGVVVGRADPDRLLTNAKARPGDRLLLSKPLGTGAVINGFRGDLLDESKLEPVLLEMERLNAVASRLAVEHGARACTDVTGFGLLVHAPELAPSGEVDFRWFLHKLPWLPGAVAYGEGGAFPGGTTANQQFFAPWVEFAPEVSQLYQDMLWTPETSGGLLVAINPEHVETYMSQCPTAVIVGEVSQGDGHLLIDN